MERTKRKSSVYNDCVPYGGRVPNFKEKEGMKLKKEQFDVTGMTCSACSARIEKSVSKLPGVCFPLQIYILHNVPQKQR